MEQLPIERLEKMNVAELDVHLDHAKGHCSKAYLVMVMKVRNDLIMEDEAACWGLSVEQYLAVKHKAEEVNRLEYNVSALELTIKKLKARVDEHPEQSAVELAGLEASLADLRSKHDEAKERHVPLLALLTKMRNSVLRANLQSAKAGVANASSSAI